MTLTRKRQYNLPLTTLKVTLILCSWTFTLIFYAFACAEVESTKKLQIEPSTGIEDPSIRDIPMTGIAHEAPLGDYPGEPLYTVVTYPEEWNKLKGRIPAPIIETAIRTGESNDNLILIAFAGVKPSSGYSITIKRVVQNGDSLFIHIFQTRPSLNKIVEPATTLPYHLVTLAKENLYPAHILTFIFYDEKENALTQGYIKLGSTNLYEKIGKGGTNGNQF